MTGAFLAWLAAIAVVGAVVIVTLAAFLDRADRRRWDPPPRPSTGPDSIYCWWPGCPLTSRTAVIHRTSPKGPGARFEGLCPDHMGEWILVRHTVNP